MAAIIQVRSSVKACPLLSCLLCLFCVITANTLDLEIPNNAQPGYYVTKLGCSKNELDINVQNPVWKSFEEFFNITSSGDLIVHKCLSEHSSKYFVLSVKRTNSECSVNLPLYKRTINIRITDSESQMPSFSKSIYNVVLSQNGERYVPTMISTTQALKKGHLYGEGFKFEIIGDSKELFVLKITINGLEIIKLPNSPIMAPEYHFTIVAKNQEGNAICFTHLRVRVMMNDKRQEKLTGDMTEARKRLVAMTIKRREKTLRTVKTSDRQLAVSFNQDNSAVPVLGNLEQHHNFRSKRHAIRKRQTTRDLSADVNEDVTGTLYTITRGGNSGNTFILSSVTPAGFVTVSTDGAVSLAVGKKMDYDAGMRTIAVNVNEVTGAGAGITIFLFYEGEKKR